MEDKMAGEALNPQAGGRSGPGMPANAGSSLPAPGLAPGTLHNLFLDGAAGRLEAVLNEGRADAAFAAVVCHPHPLGGGTLHNKVVYHAAKVLAEQGWPVLRFNFRSVGLSAGAHDGRAEIADVCTALDWLGARYGKPIFAAGFSFGAAMGLMACCADSRVKAFAALGLPTHAEGRDYHYHFLSRCRLPKLLLSGDQDQFAPAEQLRAVAEAAAGPTELELIAGADHFFTGHLTGMQHALRHWVGRTCNNAEGLGRGEKR